MNRSTLWFALALCAFGSACGDDAVVEDRTACEEIVERCHPLDTSATGPIHECHEFAENPSVTNAQCQAMHDSCFATCTEVADAAVGDASVSDAAVDAAQ